MKRIRMFMVLALALTAGGVFAVGTSSYLKKLPAHILGVEGELIGVLFFALCGLIVLLVPFLDFGAARGGRRLILNMLATIAVIGFIVMTAWGLLE